MKSSNNNSNLGSLPRIGKNRTILLMFYMMLSGFLAYIKAEDILAILTAVGGVLMAIGHGLKSEHNR
jgi:hypothetical protein